MEDYLHSDILNLYKSTLLSKWGTNPICHPNLNENFSAFYSGPKRRKYSQLRLWKSIEILHHRLLKISE